jgi:protein-S-isoprenylcysteine O-methyltransferase Ste14
MNNAQELNFGYKVRHALNEALDTLPSSTTERLASARKIALSRKKNDAPLQVLVRKSVLAGQVANFVNEPFSWLGRFGLAIPIVVLVVGLVGIIQYEQQQRINETADIDAAMLTDDLPLTAYADHGFNAYLEKRAE